MMFDLPKDSRSIIKVIGVGGGGGNAVTHMFNQGIVGVDFAICNTDAQAMELSPVPTRISLGPAATEGRGAGNDPEVGRKACVESIEEVRTFLEDGTKMLFITAGMGGGTGTGAAPIIAKTAQEMGILTVGIVTLPFTFEGRKRGKQGMGGLEEMKKYVDTLIIISNDKLRQIHGNLSLSAAFAKADDILTTAAKGIAEIITVPGYVNVDFEDVNTVMRSSGVAIMGTATAEGEDRAKKAVDAALSSPLLEDNSIKGAKYILLNISSGVKEVTMDEIFEITEFVQEEAGFGTDLIWGNCYDENLGEKLTVTIIATGFEHRSPNTAAEPNTEKIVVSLDDTQEDLSVPGRRELLENQYLEEQKSTAPAPTNTVEFTDIKQYYDKYGRTRYSYEEPYLKDEEKIRLEEERRRRQELEMQRRERERKRVAKMKLNNPNVVRDLESEPAYIRRRVHLDDVPHSSDPTRSRWTISDDDEPEIRSDNSFLHDNVD